MKNFLKIAEGCDVMPLMCALVYQPDLWNQNTLRTTIPGTPHSQVSDIWLRFNDMERAKKTGDASYVFDEHESIEYPAFHALPAAQKLIFELMVRVRGERLGRCLITKLPPGRNHCGPCRRRGARRVLRPIPHRSARQARQSVPGRRRSS